MKLVACTWVLLAAALLTACGPHKKSLQLGAVTADRFVAAWHCDARSASEADSVLEAGIAAATDPDAFIAAFVQNVEARGNDTATLAAKVLALPPRRLAQVVAEPIVRGMAAGTVNRQQARERIALIVQVGALLKTPDQIRAVSDGLQQAVDHLELPGAVGRGLAQRPQCPRCRPRLDRKAGRGLAFNLQCAGNGRVSRELQSGKMKKYITHHAQF